ncbi:hypothetical protein E2I00_003572, partial [Balaenoptera physalus]
MKNHSLCTSLRKKDQALLLSSWVRELQPWTCPPAMAATASPLPPTAKVAGSENSSSFYGYEYYLRDVACMLCRKDEALSFGRVFLPLFYGLVFVLGLDEHLETACAQPHPRLRTRAKSLLLAAAACGAALRILGGHGTIWKLFLRFQQNLLGFLLPLLAMIFFYSRIGSVLARLRPPGQGRALRMAVGLVVAFFVLWFPYNVTLFLHSLLDLQAFGDCTVSQRLDYALQVTESIAFLHCCFTPVLYAFSSRRFRQYLKALLATVLRRHQAPYLAQAP